MWQWNYRNPCRISIGKENKSLAEWVSEKSVQESLEKAQYNLNEIPNLAQQYWWWRFSAVDCIWISFVCTPKDQNTVISQGVAVGGWGSCSFQSSLRRSGTSCQVPLTISFIRAEKAREILDQQSSSWTISIRLNIKMLMEVLKGNYTQKEASSKCEIWNCSKHNKQGNLLYCIQFGL